MAIRSTVLLDCKTLIMASSSFSTTWPSRFRLTSFQRHRLSRNSLRISRKWESAFYAIPMKISNRARIQENCKVQRKGSGPCFRAGISAHPSLPPKNGPDPASQFSCPRIRLSWALFCAFFAFAAAFFGAAAFFAVRRAGGFAGACSARVFKRFNAYSSVTSSGAVPRGSEALVTPSVT